MTIVSPMGQVRPAFTDKNGKRLAGGKVFTYMPGTLTPKPTYANAEGTIPNTNPVMLDASGEADIYLDGPYRIQVYDRYDVLMVDQDNFRTWAGGIPASSVAYKDQDLQQFNAKVESDIDETKRALTGLSLANKTYATLAAANADIANIAVNQSVWVSSETEGGLYEKSTADATSLTKSAFDPLTQAKDAIPQNLLFDPFNETVRLDKVDNVQSTANAVFDTIVTSTTFNKPALKSDGQVRRYIDTSKLSIKSGKYFFVRVHANYTEINATTKLCIYLRKANNDVISSKVVDAVVGVNDVIFESLIMTNDANHLLILLDGDKEKQLNAAAVSLLLKPELIYGAPPAKIVRDVANNTTEISKNATDIASIKLSANGFVHNVMPDPFFKSYKNGITTIDDYPLISDSGWSVVTQPLSPFISKNAIYVDGSGNKNRNIRFDRLGVKAGDTITFRAGLIVGTTGVFQVACYVRNSAGTVIGTATSSGKTLTKDVYDEVAHTIDVTQEMINSGATLQCRLNVGGAAITGGWYCCAMAVYVNNATQQIRENQSYVDDEMRKLIKDVVPIDAVPHDFGASFLQETHQRAQKLKDGGATKLTITSIGDSWMQGAARWVRPTALDLFTKLGDGGGGWLGFGFLGSLINQNIRANYYYSKTGTWTSTYGNGSSVSPDACHVTSSTAGDKLTVNANANTPVRSAIDLFYIGSADGIVRYRINSGAWTTLNLNNVANGNLGITTLSGINESGYTVLEIEVVSGTCNLAGVNFKSDANGVVWHKLGASGSQAFQWASINATEWKKGIAALNPNQFIISFGTNDQGANRSVSTFAASISTLIDNVKSAVSRCDIIVIMPCENLRTTNTVLMSDYSKAVYEVCKIKKVSFVDLQTDFGFVPADYSHWFGDLIHPSETEGGFAIKASYLKFCGMY